MNLPTCRVYRFNHLVRKICEPQLREFSRCFRYLLPASRNLLSSTKPVEEEKQGIRVCLVWERTRHDCSEGDPSGAIKHFFHAVTAIVSSTTSKGGQDRSDNDGTPAPVTLAGEPTRTERALAAL
ncbi:cell division protein FtsK [Anopheles sinensis]|uniref:Cell division protein FtsK n=1 Tax=Anopheles sinensis TaxID=74873 RepID=A0A084VYU7_ANOSI|nr:cell division protein FtsK [Anopheles sinensis]